MLKTVGDVAPQPFSPAPWLIILVLAAAAVVVVLLLRRVLRKARR